MRRKTTRTVVALLSAFALVLAACGNDDAEPEDESTDEMVEEEPEEEPEGEAEEEPEAEAEEEPEAEATDFPTRDINFITRGSPGGGHDTFTRAMAPLLEEELGVTVTVENMTGGGGLVAYDYMMNSAEPDGYEIHIMDPVGLVANAIAESDGPGEFSFNESFNFPFLGTVTQRPTTFAVAPDSDIQTWDDFVARLEGEGLAWSHTGLGSTHAYNNMIVLDALGLPEPTFVPHEGSAEAFTALARGDGDFVVLAADSVADAASQGDVRPLMTMGSGLEDLLPGAQSASEVGLEEFEDVLLSSLAIVAPPDTPQEIVDILRAAVEAVAFSDEFAQWGEENDRLVLPLDGAGTEAFIRNLADLYNDNYDIIAPMVEG